MNYLAQSAKPKEEPSPRRLRRWPRVYPDRNGNISYLVTICVEGRSRVLDNEIVFQRLVTFLLVSPQRYQWFAKRFVLMPDHLHMIVRMGPEAIELGLRVKALKAVVAGLKKEAPEREPRPVRVPGLQNETGAFVGRVPLPGAS